MTQTVDQLMSGGGKSAKWTDVNKSPIVGKTYKGTIESLTVTAQTDMDGNIKRFDDGQAREQLQIVLSTGDNEGGDDDGRRTLYAAGGTKQPGLQGGRGMLEAIKAALGKAECKTIEVGGTLAVKLVELKPSNRPGLSPTYLYVAEYRPPAPAAVDPDGLL